MMEFVTIPLENGKTTGEVLKDYVLNANAYIDFVFLGNHGADFSSKDHMKYLGSVAREMITKTNVNVFFMTWS